MRMNCLSCGNQLPERHRMQLCTDCLRKHREPQVDARAIKLALGKWRPAWHEQAACRGKDPNLFHTELFGRDRGNPLASHAVRVAKFTCASCPVRRECLSDELAYEALHGPQPSIRGGTLPNERSSVSGPQEARIGQLLEQMDLQAEASGLKRKVA